MRRYGKGNWKDIKMAYPDVFEERSTACILGAILFLALDEDLGLKFWVWCAGRSEGQVQKYGKAPWIGLRPGGVVLLYSVDTSIIWWRQYANKDLCKVACRHFFCVYLECLKGESRALGIFSHPHSTWSLLSPDSFRVDFAPRRGFSLWVRREIYIQRSIINDANC